MYRRLPLRSAIQLRVGSKCASAMEPFMPNRQLMPRCCVGSTINKRLLEESLSSSESSSDHASAVEHAGKTKRSDRSKSMMRMIWYAKRTHACRGRIAAARCLVRRPLSASICAVREVLGASPESGLSRAGSEVGIAKFGMFRRHAPASRLEVQHVNRNVTGRHLAHRNLHVDGAKMKSHSVQVDERPKHAKQSDGHE